MLRLEWYLFRAERVEGFCLERQLDGCPWRLAMCCSGQLRYGTPQPTHGRAVCSCPPQSKSMNETDLYGCLKAVFPNPIVDRFERCVGTHSSCAIIVFPRGLLIMPFGVCHILALFVD